MKETLTKSEIQNLYAKLKHLFWFTVEKEENAQAKAQEEEDACKVQIIFPHIFSVGINTNLVLKNKFINLTTVDWLFLFLKYFYSLNISQLWEQQTSMLCCLMNTSGWCSWIQFSRHKCIGEIQAESNLYMCDLLWLNTLNVQHNILAIFL